MSISYVGTTGSASTTGTPSNRTWVTGHQSGDLGLLLVVTINQPISAPSGWTEVPGSPVTYGSNPGDDSNIAISVFYKFATSSAEASVPVPDSGAATYPILFVYRGVSQTTPFDYDIGTGTTSTATNSFTLPEISTTYSETQVVHFIGSDADATSSSAYDSFSNSVLTSLTERHDRASSNATGLGYWVGDGLKSDSGLSGVTTVNHDYTANAVFLVLALVADGATGSTMGSASGKAQANAQGFTKIIATGSSVGMSYVYYEGLLPVGTAIGSSSANGIALAIFTGIGESSGSAFALGDGITISNMAPKSIFGSGYTFDGTNIIIQLDLLPGLSIEEADSISGSWVDIFQALCIFDHNRYEIYSPTVSPNTMKSWNNRNMNAKSSNFRYGIGELNTFLKYFTISYGITHLVDEN